MYGVMYVFVVEKYSDVNTIEYPNSNEVLALKTGDNDYPECKYSRTLFQCCIWERRSYLV